jgi:hypothetical protein
MKSISVDPANTSKSKDVQAPLSQPHTHHAESRAFVHKLAGQIESRKPLFGGPSSSTNDSGTTASKLFAPPKAPQNASDQCAFTPELTAPALASLGRPHKLDGVEKSTQEALIIDLQDENKKLLAKVDELTRSNSELTDTYSKYETFRKTVVYYSNMLRDLIHTAEKHKGKQEAVAKDPGMSRNTLQKKRSSIYSGQQSLAPQTPTNTYDSAKYKSEMNMLNIVDIRTAGDDERIYGISIQRLTYLKNLINGLQTFATSYDSSPAGHGTGDATIDSEGNALGASTAADMMTASISMSNELRRSQPHGGRGGSPPNKYMLSAQRPVILGFVQLAHETEMGLARMFGFLLFAERNLFELTHNSLDSISKLEAIRGRTSGKPISGTAADPTTDEWAGKRAFLTMLFIIDAYDQR